MTTSSKLGELNILSGELEKVHDKKGQLAGYLLDGKVEWSSFGDSFFAEGLMTIDPTVCWVTEVVGKVRTRSKHQHCSRGNDLSQQDPAL
jgi:hypothetical protein